MWEGCGINILELWIWKDLDAVSRTQWAVLGASLEDQNTKRNAGSRGPPPKTAEGEGHVLGTGTIWLPMPLSESTSETVCESKEQRLLAKKIPGQQSDWTLS